MKTIKSVSDSTSSITRVRLSGVLIATATFTLYAIDLARAPIYLHEAEVLFALHAHAISATAHDLYGRFMPLYFQMRPIGENVWFHPVIVYVSAVFFKVLPLNEWTTRLPSAAVGTIDVVLTYAIARRMFAAERAAVAAAVLLALTPAHFIHSRIAMDYLYPVPFVLGWLLSLTIYLERDDARFLFAATTLLGIGIYSYIAAAIMMPLYLLITLAAIARERKPFRASIIAVTGFVWPLALFAAWVWIHPQFVSDTLTRYGQPRNVGLDRGFTGLPLPVALEQVRRLVSVSGVIGRISMYWYFFDPAYLFLSGGYANVVNSTRHVGVFLAPLLVFVPAGIIAIATGRRSTLDLIVLAGFLSAPLAACLVVPEPYAIDRELELLPFAALIATRGIERLSAARRPLWRVVTAALLALVPLHFGYFLFDYFGDYRTRSATWFNGNRRGAFESILEHAPRVEPPAIYLSTTRTRYVDAYWRFYLVKHRREDLLQRTTYFDDGAIAARSLQPGTLIVAGRDDASLFAQAASGDLRLVETVPEPGDPPQFSIFVR